MTAWPELLRLRTDQYHRTALVIMAGERAVRPNKIVAIGDRPNQG